MFLLKFLYKKNKKKKKNLKKKNLKKEYNYIKLKNKCQIFKKKITKI